MIKWTKQMLEELKGEVNLKEFAKKYNMSEASARLKKEKSYSTNREESRSR